MDADGNEAAAPRHGTSEYDTHERDAHHHDDHAHADSSHDGHVRDSLHDNHASDNCGGTERAFDTHRFLRELDGIFHAHDAATGAEPYLLHALDEARGMDDKAGELTVLNEMMGFYRSQGRHDDNLPIIERTLSLARRMGLEGTETWTTTLINAATGMRAAGRREQARDLYEQALRSAASTYTPHDRRLAALHNNLSMLHSQSGDLDGAQRELETALDILLSSSVDPLADIDIASSHTNLALVLVERSRREGTDQETGTGVHNNRKDPDCAPCRHTLLDTAMTHATAALDIYRHGHLEHSAHYASALAGYAQALFASGSFAQAARVYRQSLEVIARCYGTDTEYYRITAENLREAQRQDTQDTQDKRKRNSRECVLDHADEQGRGTDNITDDSDSPRNRPHDTLEPSFPAMASNPADSSGKQGQENDLDQTDDATPTGSRTSALQVPSRNIPQPSSAPHPSHRPQPPAISKPSATTHPPLTGMSLARKYWLAYGKPLIDEHYAPYRERIAAGLVGHGSECYGFDDTLSQDHDFGPGFCLWLTDEDYATIGERLQNDYESLPSTFMGHGPRVSTPRAHGADRRVGVFSVSDFFTAITGYPQAPDENSPHAWLMLDEATLAAATNGAVFADPHGLLLRTRQGFKNMPEDVRLALISRRLGMMAQSGQYNFPRMLARNDGASASTCLHEFVNATASLVFLINSPITVGYLPYYKWRFAALRRLSSRPATRLAQVCEQLESILRLSSAACFGGAGFGEGGKGSDPAISEINRAIESICVQVVSTLRREGLSDSTQTFLEWQRPHVEEHIVSTNPCLHSLHDSPAASFKEAHHDERPT